MSTIKLMFGDCLERMKEIPDGSVDMVLCDLPYGTTACKWDSVIPLEPMWKEYNRLTRTVALTASQPFTSVLVSSNLKQFRHEWVWLKNRGTNPMSAKVAPMKRHESILIFSKPGLIYNPQMRKGKGYVGFSSDTSKTGEVMGSRQSKHKHNPDGVLLPISNLEFKCEFGLHPTQKPVALMEYLIRTYTDEGQTVLDNTMGSGTTGVACVNTGRNFIGIERDLDYFLIAEKRIREAELAAL